MDEKIRAAVSEFLIFAITATYSRIYRGQAFINVAKPPLRKSGTVGEAFMFLKVLRPVYGRKHGIGCH
jgi:hypothetical protein